MFNNIVGAVGGIILAALMLVGTLVPSLLVYGYVLSHLWDWFVVPLFGLPALGMAAAIGLSMVTTYMSSGRRNGREIEQKLTGMAYFNNYVSYHLCLPFFLLGVGYLVQRCL